MSGYGEYGRSLFNQQMGNYHQQYYNGAVNATRKQQYNMANAQNQFNAANSLLNYRPVVGPKMVRPYNWVRKCDHCGNTATERRCESCGASV